VSEEDQQSAARVVIRFEVFSIAVAGIGFVGLGALAVLRWILGTSESQFMAEPAGALATWVFTILFLVGMVVLFPLAVFARRRSIPPPPSRPMPWWGIFAIIFGGADPDWTMPRWITWPVMTLFALLLLFLIVAMVASFMNEL
jgi:hypothetical protein